MFVSVNCRLLFGDTSTVDLITRSFVLRDHHNSVNNRLAKGFTRPLIKAFRRIRYAVSVHNPVKYYKIKGQKILKILKIIPKYANHMFSSVIK